MTVLGVVGYYEPWWIQLLKAVVIFAVVFQLVPVALLAERKLLGRFQYRYGPNRVGGEPEHSPAEAAILTPAGEGQAAPLEDGAP